jgi:hypothetical protein
MKRYRGGEIIDDTVPKKSRMSGGESTDPTPKSADPTPRSLGGIRTWTIKDQMEQEGLGNFGYVEPGNTYEVEVNGVMKNFLWNEGPLSYNRWDGSKGNYLDMRDDGSVPDSKTKPKVELKDAKSLEQLIINDLMDLDKSLFENQEAYMEMKKKQRIEREGGDFDWDTEYRGESSEIREKYKNMRNRR